MGLTAIIIIVVALYHFTYLFLEQILLFSLIRNQTGCLRKYLRLLYLGGFTLTRIFDRRLTLDIFKALDIYAICTELYRDVYLLNEWVNTEVTCLKWFAEYLRLRLLHWRDLCVYSTNQTCLLICRGIFT